jgi:glycosyltransferase involved in cell wall biosynthesis
MFRAVPNPYISDEMMVDGPPSDRRGSAHVLTAGRMVAQKRFDLLLQSFARTTHRDARLTILGDGPLRSSLEALARSLGIAERIAMPGYSTDVSSHLRQSDLFVLSSDYEGLPAVVLEALASNVPVVTTDSFLAARELLGAAPSCEVVPIRDPEALARAIDRSLAAKRGTDELRKLAEPYCIDAAIVAHIDALNKLVEERRQTAAA